MTAKVIKSGISKRTRTHAFRAVIAGTPRNPWIQAFAGMTKVGAAMVSMITFNDGKVS